MACTAPYRTNKRTPQADELVTRSQMKIIDKTIAEHYTWGQNCDGWRFVRTDAISVIRELMPPHTCEICHKHIKSRQFFFVLSGEAIIEIEGESQVLHPEQGLEISPGAVHQIFNNSNTDLNFLVISCPPSYNDRINV